MTFDTINHLTTVFLRFVGLVFMFRVMFCDSRDKESRILDGVKACMFFILSTL